MANCGGSTNPVSHPPRPARVLVVTETQGFRHSSIPTAVEAVRVLGDSLGDWNVVGVVDAGEDVAEAITAGGLDTVDLVVFANTTGTLSFTPDGRDAFYDWMDAGGRFVGIHSASDTFHDDPTYVGMLGGEFLTHGPQVTVTVVVQDTTHPATAALPDRFEIFDEIYQFQEWSRDRVHMLLALRGHPQSGEPGDFPLAWTRRFGEGRVFYTALGHREDVYADPRFRAHLAGGIRWALGYASGDDTYGLPPR
jgi:type 1 glutamine amidotransferase